MFSALQGYSNKHKQRKGKMIVSLQKKHKTQTQGNAGSAPVFAMADYNNSCYWEKVKSTNMQTHKHKPLLLVLVLLVNNGLVVIRGWYCCGGKVLVSTLHKAPPPAALTLWREKEKLIRGKLVHRRSVASASSGSRTKQGQRNYDRDASPQHAIHPPTSHHCPCYNSVASHLVH